MSLRGRLVKDCLRCGESARFVVPLPDPEAKPTRGGREKSDAPLPLLWQCGCGHATPLVLQPHEAV